MEGQWVITDGGTMVMTGGDIMFSIVPVIVGMGFFIVFGLIIVSIIKGISEWSDNNKQDVVTYKARIVAKRQHVSDTVVGGTDTTAAHTVSSSDYFVTFQDEYGARQEFRVKDRDYGLMAEGDTGILSHQGTRFKGFERDRNGDML